MHIKYVLERLEFCIYSEVIHTTLERIPAVYLLHNQIGISI